MSFFRACHIIKQLKMTAKGRLIMREHFWPTFCRLFSMGDACAIETLVYHEIVNFRTEMTEVTYKFLLTKILQRAEWEILDVSRLKAFYMDMSPCLPNLVSVPIILMGKIYAKLSFFFSQIFAV